MKSNNLGKFLKDKRNEKNVLMKDLAKLLNVDLSFISKIEGGRRSVNPKHFKKISKILSVPEKDICSIWIYDSIINSYGNNELWMESFMDASVKIKQTFSGKKSIKKN